MAYNTKAIITDINGNPISQYYNPDTDGYEPLEGSMGANKVILYKGDGTENNDLSLLPILDKLSELTGTTIDERTRQDNELQRIAFYDLLQQMLADGELQGEQGIRGIDGKGLEFEWRGTELGVRVEGDTDYIYTDLKGDSGSIDNLNSQDIEDALGYNPIGKLEEHNLDELSHPYLLEEFNTLHSMGILPDIAPRTSLDLNNESTMGWVLTDTNTLNIPTGNPKNYIVRTEFRSSDRLVQSAYVAGGNDHVIEYRRVRGSDGWGTWEKIVTDAPIPWINATLQNGWTGFLQYRKNALGIVEVGGVITSGTITNSTIITNLPSSHSPIRNKPCLMMRNSDGLAYKGAAFISSGELKLYGSEIVSGTYHILDMFPNDIRL